MEIEQNNFKWLLIGIFIGVMLISLVFAWLYHFSFSDMAFQDCEKSLNLANEAIKYCNEIITMRNNMVGGYHFNFT